MSPLKIRKTTLKIGAKAIIHAASAMHQMVGTPRCHDDYDEERIPLTQFPFTSSCSSDEFDAEGRQVNSLIDFDDGDMQAYLQRTAQWNAWAHEHDERKTSLEDIVFALSGSPGTGRRGSAPGALGEALHPPKRDVRVCKVKIVEGCEVESLCASIHEASELDDDDDVDEQLRSEDGDESDASASHAPLSLEPMRASVRATFRTPIYEQMHDERRGILEPYPHAACPPAMSEQQTGIIRSQSLGALDQLLDDDAASDFSLRRRGAMRRKSNPLFARPKWEDFQRHRPSW
ncbi:hypothetical protein CC86DRAFT_400639 [Ophiobolus disseminans]|uniref:Uncharacterized protein n=1 Tax=Ophiobolus disseminans TaxID=1469910 RepID=A0A6A7AF53_9PLEO|nr:hypothetical protein CC86DRAFT_400639 [Ophiobolus disseminans]